MLVIAVNSKLDIVIVSGRLCTLLAQWACPEICSQWLPWAV